MIIFNFNEAKCFFFIRQPFEKLNDHIPCSTSNKMGIKHINRYLKKYCNKGIQHISIEKLRGKTIVIDTSIYMYKFLEENALLENFFVLITNFREQDITPLFIFDGKADASKMDLLWKRVMKKRDALNEYHQLKEKIESSNESEKQFLKAKMEICRKKSTRIQDHDLTALKQLFDAMGVFYYTAEKEADIVCAYFVKRGFAWACMSDDMDMFVYGCSIVLREWNIDKSSGLLYDRNQIMKEVRVKPEHFSHLLLLMGSDYNQQAECVVNVYTAFKWYDEFINRDSYRDTFYHWLQNTRKISSVNETKLETISDMYIVPEDDDSIDMNKTLSPHMINWNELKKLMAPYGFVIM
jgi:5'-3' exonuclease